MNNEPVAWMFEYGTDRGDAVNGISWYPNVHFKKPDLSGLIRNIEPLYTHPVKDKPHPKCDEACMYLCQMRELTDEEIMEIVADKYEKGHGRYIDTKLFFVEFARAILRKAQEK